jgi:hypothetical protein
MPGLVPGIHVFLFQKGVDGRDTGARSDAVLRTAMPGHDERERGDIESYFSSTIFVRSTPMPEISTSSVSPGFIQSGGLRL